MWLIGVCTAVAAVMIYVWLTWNFDYWMKKKIPYLKPSIFYGNLKQFIQMKRCRGLVYDDLYRQGEEPVLGIFNMRAPQWLIRDPALMKVITINEFSNFRDNDVYTTTHDFIRNTNVFFFSGDRWKKQRSIITPALSMSKLKLFVPYMMDVAKEMIQYVEQHDGKVLDATAFAGLFTTETAMNYVYGIKCNTFKEPMSEYRRVFLEIFQSNLWNKLKFNIVTACPQIGRIFKIGFTPKSFLNFYLNVVAEAVDYKKKNPGNRKDFLQFLIDEGAKDGAQELTIYEMTGLTMNLAADATETTCAGLASVLECLARFPEQQARLRQEVDERIDRLDDVDFDKINTMNYLGAFISESLRILTPIPLLEKKCTNDCVVTFDNRKYSFRKGDKIALPVYSYHNDPKYFENPGEFNPERFLNSGADTMAFCPFGAGPRMCLGKTFTYVQMKVFVCALIKHFEILPKDNRLTPWEFDPGSRLFLHIKGGIWIRAERR